MRTNITKNSLELFQSPQKTLYDINTHVPFSFADSTNQALHVILNSSDIESFYCALEQLHGSFSDSAQQEFRKPEFVMSELLLKEG